MAGGIQGVGPNGVTQKETPPGQRRGECGTSDMVDAELSSGKGSVAHPARPPKRTGQERVATNTGCQHISTVLAEYWLSRGLARADDPMHAQGVKRPVAAVAQGVEQ